MLRYGGIAFDYEPYPVGVVRPAFEEADYRQLAAAFPPLALFEYKPDKGGKYSLSQVNHPRLYRRFIRQSPPWRRFHAYVKSPRFIAGALAMLRAHGLDLGLPGPGPAQRLYLRARAWKRGSPLPHFPRLKARFEFSGMPVDGGNILPHTDHPKKLVTMVVAMPEADGWNGAWGGGTAVVRPRDPRKRFNRMNAYLEFGEVECLRTYPYEPNQCLIFLKTDASWHAVWPMTGAGATAVRRTLTINIESS